MNLKTRKSIASERFIPPKNFKKVLKLFLKIFLTALAVYLVVRKIDVEETLKILFSLNVFWILPAVVFFNFSKIVSALRLMVLLRVPGIQISKSAGIKLCYVGMFYNLFLPGGIGGDGYKVYLIKKYFKDHSLKKIVASALLDRISGMIALVFLALILYFFSSASQFLTVPWVKVGYFLLLVFFYPLAYSGTKIFFRSFRKVFWKTSLQSLEVQLLQLIAALFILISMTPEGHYVDYLSLFLISSVVAVVPFTIGGIGARELVFLYGYEFLPIDKHQAVAFSITFFLISVISSLPGIFLKAEHSLRND